MLLVFSHFFVPTMQLCPLGRSMLRPNRECYFPHPIPMERPRCTVLPWLCRDTHSPHPAAAWDRALPHHHQTPNRRQNLHPTEPQAQVTGGGKQGDQTSTDDSNKPSRDWISSASAPRGGSSWEVHHCFLHETPNFKVDQNISIEIGR